MGSGERTGPGPPVSGATSPDILDTPQAGPAAIRGSALRTAGYAAGVLLSLASAPLLIRHLGVADFGRYVTIVSLVSLVGGFTEAGINAIALREYASLEGEARERTLRNLLGIRIALTLSGVVIAVGFALAAGYESVLVIGVFAAGAGFLVQVVQTLLVVPLQGSLRFGWVTFAELLRQVVTVVGIVALVLAGAGILPFFFLQIPAAGAALVLTVVLVRRLIPLRPAIDPAEWWPLLKDTLPYAAAIAVNSAYFRIAVVILSLVATEIETGYFATSFRVMEVLIAVPPILIGAAFPILARAARDDGARLAYATGRLLEIGLILGLWTLLALELAAEPIMDVLAGEEGEGSVPVLRIQAVAIVATFVAVAAGFPLLSLRRHRELLLANLAALCASVGLTFALAPAHGARGAAIATVAAELALAAVTVFLLVRRQPALRGTVRRVPAALGTAGACALVVLVPDIPPVADAAAALVLFPLLLAAVGLFPPEVGDAIRDRSAGEPRSSR